MPAIHQPVRLYRLSRPISYRKLVPVLLNDPAYVGVAVTSLPGRPGFHRVRTPQVDQHQVAAIIRATTGLRADPAVLLAETAPGLRIVPGMPAPGDAA
jgi:hypothetical protein